ncbi:MAG: shikimate kinase [Burkholderiales bacterium]|nr:shikimate kinase [Burkholderiales bacterium]
MQSSKKKKDASLILIGMMGAGKTHVGKKLAEKLSKEFIDLDKLMEERSGATIPQIFTYEGEEGFRKRETELLKEICQTKNKVVASGGGIVVTPVNRELLRNSEALVIHLKVSARTSWLRTQGSNRPLLRTPDPLAKITDLIKIRTPWYQETADLEFDGNSKTVDLDIIKWLDKNLE